MAEHLTEEEQLESLKRWWAENGKSTVLGVVVVVVGYLGWNLWKDQQQANAEAASAQYELLQQALVSQPGQPLPEDQATTASNIADTLQQDYDATLYASLGALADAKLAVAADDLALAADKLQWVIGQNQDSALTSVAKMRLARVLAAQADYEQALAQVADTDDISFKGAFAEIRGDILVDQNKLSEARGAYQMALEYLLQDLEPRRVLIEIKLADLQPADASADTEKSSAQQATTEQESNS